MKKKINIMIIVNRRETLKQGLGKLDEHQLKMVKLRIATKYSKMEFLVIRMVLTKRLKTIKFKVLNNPRRKILPRLEQD
jgi:hypothetical protein